VLIPYPSDWLPDFSETKQYSFGQRSWLWRMNEQTQARENTEPPRSCTTENNASITSQQNWKNAATHQRNYVQHFFPTNIWTIIFIISIGLLPRRKRKASRQPYIILTRLNLLRCIACIKISVFKIQTTAKTAQLLPPQKYELISPRQLSYCIIWNTHVPTVQRNVHSVSIKNVPLLFFA